MTAAFLTTRNTGRLDPSAAAKLLPAIALALMLAAIFSLQPRTMSYFGLKLLLNLAVPVAWRPLSQISSSRSTTWTFPSAASWACAPASPRRC